MTSSLHHNDVIFFKILSFTKISPIKEEKFRDVFGFKKRQINGTKEKENFLFKRNKGILKKLSITKRVFSAKIQCTNVTLARKL